MKNDYHRSQFRLPWELYERLKAETERSGRSLNGEIVARLEASFEPPVIEQIGLLIERQTRQLIEAMERREEP